MEREITQKAPKINFRVISRIFSRGFAMAALVLFAHAANAQVLPSLTILEPQEGQLYPEGEEIVARFAVGSFSFVTGHGHLWVDFEEFVHNEAQEIKNIDPISLGQLPKGTHNLKLELTRNKHISFNPPVRASVNFVVGEPLPLEFQETSKAPSPPKAGSFIVSAILVLGLFVSGAWLFRRNFRHLQLFKFFRMRK